MPYQKDDLSREYFLDVLASGHVEIRRRGDMRPRGAAVGLPVYSTATKKEAEAIRLRHCRLQYPATSPRKKGEPKQYVLTEWDSNIGFDAKKDMDALDKVRDLFRATHQEQTAKK